MRLPVVTLSCSFSKALRTWSLSQRVTTGYEFGSKSGCVPFKTFVLGNLDKTCVPFHKLHNLLTISYSSELYHTRFEVLLSYFLAYCPTRSPEWQSQMLTTVLSTFVGRNEIYHECEFPWKCNGICWCRRQPLWRELRAHNKSYSSRFIVSASLNALKLGFVVNK